VGVKPSSATLGLPLHLAGVAGKGDWVGVVTCDLGVDGERVSPTSGLESNEMVFAEEGIISGHST
jgi:hypothetical protein